MIVKRGCVLCCEDEWVGNMVMDVGATVCLYFLVFLGMVNAGSSVLQQQAVTCCGSIGQDGVVVGAVYLLLWGLIPFCIPYGWFCDCVWRG